MLVVVLGIVPGSDALDTLRHFGPTVAFLAAILVFGHLCAEAGVFSYLGAVAARGSHGDPRRLLGLVVGLAALTTATLTLDSTVVLLTPVVLATAARLAVPPRPFAYACTRLANSGSLLLPVSNLTNLLAFGASGLSFGRFAALMLLPWLAVCAIEWFALRTFFRGDLAERPGGSPADLPPVPAYALTVLAVTVALFVVTSAVDVAPAWAALAGCIALLVPRLREVRPLRLVTEASPASAPSCSRWPSWSTASPATASGTNSSASSPTRRASSPCSEWPRSRPCSPTSSTTCPPRSRSCPS